MIEKCLAVPLVPAPSNVAPIAGCRYTEGMPNAMRNPDAPAGHTHDPRSAVAIIDEQVARGERRLTDLGKRLLEARRRIEQSGIPLLNREELDRERAERRGGVMDQ